MIATLLMLVAGFALTRERRLSARIGEAYLLGTGVAAFLLMVLSIAGVPWSLPVLLAGLAVIATVAFLLARGTGGFSPPNVHVVDLLTLILIGGYARFATAAPPGESDYIGIWGYKAKQFWIARGIDWRFLENPWNVNAQVHYPILTPLVYDVHALVAGEWPERWIGIVSVACGVAALLVIRSLLAEEMGNLASALATLIVMPLVFSPYLGLAEGAMIAYGTTGLLLLRCAVKTDSARDALRAAVFLGLAASCKNEGLTLIAAAALALIAARRSRLVPRLWPALVLPLPWLLLRWLHDLPGILTSTGLLDRVLERVADPIPILRALAAHPVGPPLFWIGVTAAYAIGWRRIAGEERFLAVAVALQLLFFLGAYLVTPFDPAWHIQWSWERIVRQLMPALTLLALFATPVIGFPEEHP